MRNKAVLLCLLTGYLFVSDSLRAGKNEWRSLGPDGGWISALRIAPSDTGIMYVGTWAGGMYKSTDGGKVWNAINHGLPARPFGPEYWRRDNNYSIYIIRVDTFDPQTVYIGMNGAGLYKTSDGGSFWISLNRELRAFDKPTEDTWNDIEMIKIQTHFPPSRGENE